MNDRVRLIPQCCAHVSNGPRTVRTHQCTRAARVERDGKAYCAQHDPVRVAQAAKERQDARNAKHRARNERYDAALLLQKKGGAYDAMLGALKEAKLALARTPSGSTSKSYKTVAAAIAAAEGAVK